MNPHPVERLKQLITSGHPLEMHAWPEDALALEAPPVDGGRGT